MRTPGAPFELLRTEGTPSAWPELGRILWAPGEASVERASDRCQSHHTAWLQFGTLAKLQTSSSSRRQSPSHETKRHSKYHHDTQSRSSAHCLILESFICDSKSSRIEPRTRHVCVGTYMYKNCCVGRRRHFHRIDDQERFQRRRVIAETLLGQENAGIHGSQVSDVVRFPLQMP
jgi:hypothetical protein